MDTTTIRSPTRVSPTFPDISGDIGDDSGGGPGGGPKFEDELCTSSFVNVNDPGLHRKLWSGSSSVRGKRRLPLSSRSTRDPLVVYR